MTRISEMSVALHSVSEYVPYASTATSVFHLLAKVFTRTNESSDRYWEHLTQKSVVRSVVLLVPFFGNIAIALYDIALYLTAREPKRGAEVIAKDSYHIPRGATPAQKKVFRSHVFQETWNAITNGGYTYKGKNVRLDHKRMLAATQTYATTSPIGVAEIKPFDTKFSVVEKDTLQALIDLKRRGSTNPVGINLADRYIPGGFVRQGSAAQEEAMCRSSTHLLALEAQPYPMPEMGGIYCPHIQVFRNSENQGFTFRESPEEVALVAVAAYNLGVGSEDRAQLGLKEDGVITEKELLECSAYLNGMKAKIRNMLRIMSKKGHTDIVLGALGCGAFHNPPKLVASLFKSVFQESEFKGRFAKVEFAILNNAPKDADNIQQFKVLCNALNRR